MVHYESLAEYPEPILREITRFLGVPWSERTLKSHELDLTIHRNPVSHLSGEQIKQAINMKSIGRWQRDRCGNSVFGDQPSRASRFYVPIVDFALCFRKAACTAYHRVR
jgi:hypothetical protein